MANLAEKLLARWPVRAAGPQRLWFDEDGVCLTVHVGEVQAVLDGLTGPFDAWFLDGFSPARNPAMWTPAVMQRIAALSAPGARAATFTVAADVRRSLDAAGFAVEKRPGFANKRERLEARLRPTGEAAHPLYPYCASHPKRVAIIGAGIAGAACAHALARRGVETIALEAAPTLGAGASGNPAGLVMPRLDRGGALSEVFLAAYLDAVATYERLGVLLARGVEERADVKREAALADLIADPPLPADWFSAVPGGVMHHRAALIAPQDAVKAMLAEASLMLEAPLGALEQSGDGWILRAPDGRAMLKANAVVLACGPALNAFTPASFLPLERSYGQIERGIAPAPAHTLVQGTYVAPFKGGVLFGATFDKDGQTSVPDARIRNIAALASLAPDVADGLDVASVSSRASIRAATPDRAPVAGLLPDAAAWRARFAALARGGPINLGTPAPAYAGVYVIGGLGARGLTLAPLLGERIAAEMFNQPQALSRLALDAIHPARFLHRALKRR